MSVELGILGAGNMAEAIARSVIGSGLLRSDQILAADVSPQRRQVFAEQLGIRAVDNAVEVARKARALLLSVKPQQMAGVLADIGGELHPDTLIISIAAGISSDLIETLLGPRGKWRVIRTMPNTPILVGEGMVGLARGRHATEADALRARQFFEGAADVIDVPEDKLDAVTAVSGSGPAYFFYLVEQMIRAGVELGLTGGQARRLAIKTAAGSAKMLAGSVDTPEELRRKVTSPGGTTQAAITHLDQRNVASAIVDAVKAAARRSKELGS